METFLRAYVKMIAEERDIKLTRSQLKDIVDNLCADDEIWDILDEHVNYELNEYEEEM